MEGSNIEVFQFLIDNNADLVAKNDVEKIISRTPIIVEKFQVTF